jgi:hypothetical protein
MLDPVHGRATQKPSRHCGTGSARSGQLCGAHRTALQVAPNAAWSASTCLRGATRFSQVGKQQSESDVTGVDGSTVVAHSTSAVHSPTDWSGAGGGDVSGGAGAALGAIGVGALFPELPHASATARSDENRIERELITLRSMAADFCSSRRPSARRAARRGE